MLDVVHIKGEQKRHVGATGPYPIESILPLSRSLACVK